MAKRKSKRYIYRPGYNKDRNADDLVFWYLDWSGAPPILLPQSAVRKWNGMYLPAADNSTQYPDLRLPEGDFNVCDDFDFENPKTDYDRIGALHGKWVQKIKVGNDLGIVFSTGSDGWTWWQEQKMLIGNQPPLSKAEIRSAKWTRQLVFEAKESRFVIINSCAHGAEPSEHFEVRLPRGKYAIQFAEIQSPFWVCAFRFVRVRDKSKKGAGRPKKAGGVRRKPSK